MKVSFLVTYFNQADYVRKSMDSILAIEKPCEWEILVGDDGSTDSTVDIVNEYIALYPQNIKLFIMTRDNDKKYYSVKRVSLNRINLIEHCSGDFFCILDGDDFYCDTQFLKMALKAFDKDKKLSIVAFNHQMYYSDKHCDEKRLEHKTFSNITVGRYLKKFYTPAGACVFLQSFYSAPAGRITWERIKNVGYYDDNDIVLASLNLGKMYYIDRCIYSYRQTDNSCMNSMDKLEVYTLNCIGYDTEIKISPIYKKYLKKRYLDAIVGLWFVRRKLATVLNKYNLYKELSKELSDSITYEILNYSDISFLRKIKLNIFVCSNVLVNPRFILSKIKHSILRGE